MRDTEVTSWGHGRVAQGFELVGDTAEVGAPSFAQFAMGGCGGLAHLCISTAWAASPFAVFEG